MNRVVYKILFTACSFFITTFVFIVVARNLGAEKYGQISYVLSIYDFFIQLMTLMIPTAYVYFLSQDKYTKSDLNSFIAAYVGLVGFLVLSITFLTFYSEFGRVYLWSSIDSSILIFSSFFIASAINIQAILLNFSDATLQTVKSENSKFLSKLTLFVLVIFFSFYEILTIESYLLTLGLSLIAFFVFYFKLIKFKISFLTKELFKEIFREFLIYIKPLIFFSFIAVFYTFLGKYVLQHSAGSTEQGYFGFAFQIAMLPVIIISPIIAIIMREITQHFKSNGIVEVKSLFLDRFFRILPLYTLASVFLILNAEEVISFTAGADFIEAKLTIQILALYSFLHVFGLFNSAIHLSTKRNTQYGLIASITLSAGSIYLVYIFFYGDLDSMGLAEVLTIVYFVQSIWLLLANTKFLKVKNLIFIREIISVSIVVFLMVSLIKSFNLHLLVNILGCLLVGLLLNFVFKDYLGLKDIYKSFSFRNM